MRRFFSILGMIICVGVIIVGALMLTNVLPDDYICENDGTYPPHIINGYEADFGYAMFGSDYNSFTNNNMAMAAYNAERTATNTYIIVKALEILLVAAGAIGFCAFGLTCTRKDVPKTGAVKSAELTPTNNQYSGEKTTSSTGNNIPAPGRIVQQGAANKVDSASQDKVDLHKAAPTSNYIPAWMNIKTEQQASKQKDKEPLEKPDWHRFL